MKTATFFLTALFTFTTTLLFAVPPSSQPANNNYTNAIDVSSIINSCSGNAAYTTVGATMDKNQAYCSNASGYNVWFKFQATAPTMNIKVDRGGNKGNIRRVNLALWQSNGTSQIACNRYVNSDDVVEVGATALTVGNWYYISVDNNSSNYRGTFTLCLNTTLNYDYYEGALDVSSYINSCSPNAAYTTEGATMDKSQGSCNNGSGYNRWFKFQATATTISVLVDRGSNKGTIRRVNVALMESDGTTQVGCNKYASTDDDVTINAGGLTIGNWYYISVDNNYSGYRGTFTLCLNTTIDYSYFLGAKDVSSYINSCSPNGAYTTVGATMDMNQASCSNASGYNRWFKFQATAPTMNVKVERGGNKGNIRRVNLALWQANGTSQIACNRYVNDDDDVEIGATALTVGNWYYVSVDNNYSSFCGTFTLCLNTALSYDYYEGAIDVTSYMNSSSPNAAYTTIGATMDKSQGSCNNGSGYNRWFKFQAATPNFTVKVDRGGAQGTIRRVNIVLTESNGTTQISCAKYTNNDDDVELSATSLTPGNWYYFAIDNNYYGYRGSFTLDLTDLADYDQFSNAIDVSQYINGCSADASFTNVGATMDKNQASCSNASGHNVWFKFQATSPTMNVKVDRGGTKGTIRRVNLALWQANGTSQIACNRYVDTDDDVEVGATALTVGNWYYISVDNQSSNYRGTFTLCLNETLNYDYFEGAIDVTSYINSCSPIAAYTTVGATMDKGQASCNDGSGYNRWFKFQATATTINVKVDVDGTQGTLRRANLAIMESNGTTELACNKYFNSFDDVEVAAFNLTIGNWYYIAVDNNYSGNRGSFTLCLSTTPNYDYYEGAIDVSAYINSCSPVEAYTTVGATMDKNQASCNNGSGYNRWFKFQATGPTMNVKVDRGWPRGTIRNANVAIWQADGTTQVACNRYVNLTDVVEVGATALTAGNWYYISVDNYYQSNRGSFTLCLNEALNYDYFEGAIDVSSYINSCSPNAAYTTEGATMDKAQGSCNNGSGYNRWFKFQATATTIDVTVERGGVKGDLKRANLVIMESNGTTQLACNRYAGNTDNVEVAAFNLTIGNWYYIAVDNNYSSNRGTFTLCLSTTPNYDYYQGAIDVSSYIGSCSPNAAYTTTGATSDGSQGSCSNGSGYNRWFKFQATAPYINVTAKRGGSQGTIGRISLSIMQADATTPIACKRYSSTYDNVTTSAAGLTVGNWYYITIDNNYSSYRGTFTLCMDTNMDYDFFEGAKDVSAYINSCSPNAAYTTVGATMDKTQPDCSNASGYNRWFKFQATGPNMNVKVDRGGNKGTIRRVNLSIWEANATTQLACNRYLSDNDVVEVAATGLTTGSWYYIAVDNYSYYYRGSFTLCLSTTLNYDYYEGAELISNVHNWSSSNTAYTTKGATMDKSQGSCNNGSGYNRWFKFQALEPAVSIAVKRSNVSGSIARLNATLWDADGATELACAKYASTYDNLTISYNNLIVGNWYYISVDNNASNYRGTFSLAVDNVADTFYSRHDGNWSSTSTWSNTGHNGSQASSIPGIADIVYIKGDKIDVTSDISCAAVHMDVADGNTELRIFSNRLLSVYGPLNFVNNGDNSKGYIRLWSGGDLYVQGNLTMDRTGGNKQFQISAGNGCDIEVDSNFIIQSSNGTSATNDVLLTGTATLKVNNDFKLIHTGGMKSILNLRNTAHATVYGDLVFAASNSNKAEVELEDSSELTVYGDVLRGTPAHGIISSTEQSSITYKNNAPNHTIPTSESSGTTDGIIYNNLKVNSSNGNSEFIFANDATVQGTFEVLNGTIKVLSGKKLTCEGAIVNNSTIIIEDGGSLIQTHSGSDNNTGTGNYIVKRSGNNSADSYNIWSSPTKNAAISTVFSGTNPCDVWAYNNVTQSWSYDYPIGYSTTCWGTNVTFSANDVIPGGDGIMGAGMGYFIPGSTTSTREYTGKVNNGNISVSVRQTNLGNQQFWNDDDWNLIGNPYPSALDATAFWVENAVNNGRITDAIYFWDEGDTSAGYNQYSDYASWNLLGGLNSGNSNEIPTGYIGSGQGFWVVANSNTNVEFNNSMRAGTNTQFFKEDNTPENHLAWISVTSPSAYRNNILIGFNELTTDSLDAGFDAHKLSGNSHIRFATMINTDEFSIQGVKTLLPGTQKVIPLILFTDETGVHTFTEYQRENLDAGIRILIHDIDRDVTKELSEGNYTVRLEGNKEYVNRFEIIFSNTLQPINNQHVDLGTDQPVDETGDSPKSDTIIISGVADMDNQINFTLLHQDGIYTLKNDDGILGEISVIDVTGKLVYHTSQKSEINSVQINLNNLSPGIYFLQVTNENKRVYHQEILKK